MIVAGFVSLAEPANLLEFPMLLPLGIIVGGVIAGISGTPDGDRFALPVRTAGPTFERLAFAPGSPLRVDLRIF